MKASGGSLRPGTSVSDVEVGDRVCISFTFCGRCPACLSAAPVYCQAWAPLNLAGGGRSDGSSSLCRHDAPVHSHFFGQSSFSRFVTAAARATVPVPDDLPARVLAPLGCGVQTGVCAATRVLRPAPGDRVAVYGATRGAADEFISLTRTRIGTNNGKAATVKPVAQARARRARRQLWSTARTR